MTVDIIFLWKRKYVANVKILGLQYSSTPTRNGKMAFILGAKVVLVPLAKHGMSNIVLKTHLTTDGIEIKFVMLTFPLLNVLYKRIY
ncbi:MAG TPA: hypothetical protein DDW33_05025 [Ktedonobacter sp.]|nr:hypothetical protein [Ktedonobacter sp.]